MFGAEPPSKLVSSHKVVLYPQGYASGVGRAKCDLLVHHCGGDSQRTFDLKRRTTDEALTYACRVRAFQNQQRPALCVVHQTRQLAETLKLRVAFEDLIPIASTAVWALYWDIDTDPDFLQRAQAEGTLIGEVCEGARYRHHSGSEFLLLCSVIDNLAMLSEEAELMAFSRRPQRDKARALRSSPLNIQLLPV